MARFSAVAMMGRRASRRAAAFTLVEILAAVAILALVLVILLQLTGSVLESTRYSHQKMNAARTARAALDAVGADLGQLVGERGLSVFTRASSHGSVTNSDLSFLTQSRGPRAAAPGRFAAVKYHLENGVLGRQISMVPWNGADLLTVVDQPPGSGTASDIAHGILRFVAMGVLDDGRIVPLADPGAAWLSPEVDGLAIPGGFEAVRLLKRGGGSPGAFHHVRALIIAVAALDGQALALLGDNGDALARALDDPPAGETPVETWSKLVRDGSLADFPRPVVATLHFSQNTYELK